MAENLRGEEMTVSICEFQKNIAKYERIAISKPVTVVNSATGAVFVFTGENPMIKRLADMKRGKAMTHKQVKALASA